MVRIQLHGRFAVAVDGRPVEQDLPGRRGRMLVALLADSPRSALERAVLIDLLWRPAVPDSRATATFTALLSKVRAALAPAEIRGRGSLQLVLPPGSIIDAAVAEAALHDAEAATALHDWRRAWTQALSALFVTQRRFLSDFDDPWVQERRQELAHPHRRALACYAEACLQLGPTELAGAERSARALVRLDPLSETGYCLLMRALAQRGDRGAALEVYERLCCVLREDLGAAPSPTSRAVHASLL
ncbi:AfsR/SARP family transcriptional regulator [Pseudonocardia bannensis]|uniref:Transcriptional regulator n=1 Tax=Pseudonocardia bannensis TaxID=630973 RepID=A0A848DLI3_9PSEU|nr:BTAD domain-containing putative transcriptional regulator [Pseudonocardia bannensis]NMH93415.1 transcriptional regulator [Pseudonocardia bannensis]